MGCNCGGRSAASSHSDTLGYYVILPNGQTYPAGINPNDPEAGTPPLAFYNEARAEVVANGGGTIRRLKRKPAA